MLLPEDSCGLQPKQVGAIKPVVQLFGETCVYKKIARKMYNNNCKLQLLVS
jgi:type IV secretory pathway TraG/TraD family ATPase VirD4